jgi:hypothetical protein
VHEPRWLCVPPRFGDRTALRALEPPSGIPTSDESQHHPTAHVYEAKVGIAHFELSYRLACSPANPSHGSSSADHCRFASSEDKPICLPGGQVAPFDWSDPSGSPHAPPLADNGIIWSQRGATSFESGSGASHQRAAPMTAEASHVRSKGPTAPVPAASGSATGTYQSHQEENK